MLQRPAADVVPLVDHVERGPMVFPVPTVGALKSQHGGQPSGQRIPEQQVRAETREHLGRQMVECETQVVERQGESCG